MYKAYKLSVHAQINPFPFRDSEIEKWDSDLHTEGEVQDVNH